MDKVFNVYFSPTGATRRIAQAAANRLNTHLMRPIDTVNITDPSKRVQNLTFDADDYVVFAVPTYAGRMPNKIRPFFSEQIVGNGAKAVALVTYGNRSFDNSLAELVDCLTKAGFKVEAAGAFVTRHVFSDRLAPERPQKQDFDAAGGLVDYMLGASDALLENIQPLTAIPGEADAPYYVPKGEDGEPVNFLSAKPKTEIKSCINCGICARSCPMEAIDRADVTHVPGTCIKCHACIRACAKGAKYFDDASFLSHVHMLEAHFTGEKGNALFCGH